MKKIFWTIPNGWSHLSNYPLKKLVLMHKFWYYKSPGWKKEPETLHWWSISPASCEAPGSNSTKRWQASSFHLAVLKTINFSTLRLWPAYWYVMYSLVLKERRMSLVPHMTLIRPNTLPIKGAMTLFWIKPFYKCIVMPLFRIIPKFFWWFYVLITTNLYRHVSL